MEFRTSEDAQAESFRKMFLAMAEDMRVILIKFADRLHNMRTLEYLSAAKREKIALETKDIYAPLANRLGIGWLKSEFEDLSFRFLMPDIHNEIKMKVAKKREEQEGYLDEVIKCQLSANQFSLRCSKFARRRTNKHGPGCSR